MSIKVDNKKSYKKYLIKKSKKSFKKLFTSIKRYDNIVLSIRYWLETITLKGVKIMENVRSINLKELKKMY